MADVQRVALITGSATGVGRACAVRFAQLGFSVIVNYSKSEDDAVATARLCEAFGAPVQVIAASVADDAQVKAMVGHVAKAFGGIDVLINNAGTTRFIAHDDLEAVTDEIWDEIFQVNLKGAFYCSRAAMPYLKARQGSIVNVSSVAAQSGQGSSIPYCASKGALNTLTKSLARAFGPDVRVNAVAPGPILTRWLEGRDAQIQKYLEQAPLGKAATPEDIADAVVFLAVGTALTTGQILVVDGGRTM